MKTLVFAKTFKIMRLVPVYFTLVLLLNAVTQLTGYPHNVIKPRYRATTYSPIEDSRNQWGDGDDIQVLQTTESVRRDTLPARTKPTNSSNNGLRPIGEYTPTQRTVPPYSSQDATNIYGFTNPDARQKITPSKGTDRNFFKQSSYDQPSVLCEEVQSKTSTSQTIRRSPMPLQNTKSPLEQKLETENEQKNTNCNNRFANEKGSQNATFSHSNPTELSVSFVPLSNVPRPPTTSRPSPFSHRVNQMSGAKTQHEIVFPDRLPSFKPTRTKCDGRTYCTDAGSDYPEDYIKRLLKTDPAKFKNIFGEDEALQADIHTRIDVPTDTPLCSASVEIVYPKIAQNKNDDWMYIVNVDDKKQGFRVEVCSHFDDCSLREELPWGYSFKCKQKYISRRMAAVDSKGEAVSDFFKLPSCCSCYYSVNLKSRSGGELNMSPAITPREIAPERRQGRS